MSKNLGRNTFYFLDPFYNML